MNPRNLGAYELSTDKFGSFLSQDSAPVEYEGDLYWSDNISAADLD